MVTKSSFHSFSNLRTFPLMQGYFERSIGSVSNNPDPNPEALRIVLTDLGIDQAHLKLMKQSHGNDVAYVTSGSNLLTDNVDGLITDKKGIVLGVTTADCLPLIFYDSTHEIIGACHAGYRGLLNGVIQKTLTKLTELGAHRDDIIVGVGPSICRSCYTVKKERVKLFSEEYPEMKDFYEEKNGEFFLDLKHIALFILESCGIAKNQIEFSPFCTKENTDMFFSRRVEEHGVFLTVIGML